MQWVKTRKHTVTGMLKLLYTLKLPADVREVDPGSTPVSAPQCGGPVGPVSPENLKEK